MRRLATIVLLAWFAVGLLGPLLATDLPWVARVGGSWSLPAFASYVGDAPPPPDGATSWRAWWQALADDADDFVWLAPVPIDPRTTDEARFYGRPSFAHLLGNDSTGRDVLARLIHGASTAAVVALWVVALAGLIGVTLGAIAGLRGGVVDVVVLRLIELALCFPVLVLVLCVAAFVGGSRVAVVAVLTSVYWTSFARIVRGEFLSLREHEFIGTARGLGIATWRIALVHALPCIRGSIGVVAAFVAANAITAEATLRFLGVSGGGSGAVSWGAMIAQFRVANASAWHLWVFPSLAMVSVVVALHAVADRPTAAGLRTKS